MKNLAKIPYFNDNNSVNLLTNEVNSDNKAYIVDKRLVDSLLASVTKGTLEDIKEDIKEEVIASKTKNELFERLDNYIYLNKIVGLLNPDIDSNSLDAKTADHFIDDAMRAY